MLRKKFKIRLFILCFVSCVGELVLLTGFPLLRCKKQTYMTNIDLTIINCLLGPAALEGLQGAKSVK